MRAVTFLIALLLVAPAYASAGIIVNDSVAVEGSTIMLSAQTRGRFFPKGGELVEFEVEGKSLGRVLSGGDGWAYMEFRAGKRGLYGITARHGSETGSGLVLSLSKGAEVVFIDVEGTVFSRPFSDEKDTGPSTAFEEIAKRFPLVYLSAGVMNEQAMKKWLGKKGFPEAPVLAWRGGGVFEALADMGLVIRAVVGSPDVLASARQHDAQLISFKPVEDATEVDSWQDVVEALEQRKRLHNQ